MADEQAQLDGTEDEPKTALGFGGQTIHRRLVIGDELYLLLKCEVVSDGRSRKKSDGDGLAFKAGASTTVLAELTAQEAGQIAADHG